MDTINSPKDYWLGFKLGLVESLDHPMVSYQVVSDEEAFQKTITSEMRLINKNHNPYFRKEPKIKNKEDFAAGVRRGVYTGYVIGIGSVGLFNLCVRSGRVEARDMQRMIGKYPGEGWGVEIEKE